MRKAPPWPDVIKDQQSGKKMLGISARNKSFLAEEFIGTQTPRNRSFVRGSRRLLPWPVMRKSFLFPDVIMK